MSEGTPTTKRAVGSLIFSNAARAHAPGIHPLDFLSKRISSQTPDLLRTAISVGFPVITHLLPWHIAGTKTFHQKKLIVSDQVKESHFCGLARQGGWHGGRVGGVSHSSSSWGHVLQTVFSKPRDREDITPTVSLHCFLFTFHRLIPNSYPHVTRTLTF